MKSNQYPSNDISVDQRLYIRELQTRLRAIERAEHGFSPIAVDGIFGDHTAEAVMNVQKNASLPQTGAVDLATWETIGEAYDTLLIHQHLPLPVAVYRPNQPPLKEGDTDDRVTVLQLMLCRLRQLYFNLPGTEAVTGTYSSDTAETVAALQQIMGFPITGTVNSTVWDSITRLYNRD